MKKTLNIAGAISAVLTLVGAVLKVLHLPGAGIAVVLGVAFFSLIFLPLMVVLKFRDEATSTDKIVLSSGFLIGAMTALGVLFKIMYWPGANMLMITGVSGLTFLYVPLYFFTRVRRPELRFNTVVNSVLMMATGGLLFSMMQLHGSDNLKVTYAESYGMMEEQVRELKAVTVSETGNESLDAELTAVEAQLEDMRLELLAAAAAQPENVARKKEPVALLRDVKTDEFVHKYVRPGFFTEWNDLVERVDRLSLQATKVTGQPMGLELSKIDIRSCSLKTVLMNLDAITIYLQVVRQKAGEQPV